ncbi:MAG: hypothetical protein V5A24_07495 [Haloarculaceae archaeon]
MLVVDDEETVADTHTLLLRTDQEARSAYGREATLETMDDDVDPVLLDRRRPDLHGEDVLAAIRVEG